MFVETTPLNDNVEGYIDLHDGILPTDTGVAELRSEQHGVTKKVYAIWNGGYILELRIQILMLPGVKYFQHGLDY